MKKFYYTLSIIAAIMLSSCEDNNAIDNTGTGEAEMFSLTFDSEAFMSDQDKSAQKSDTRIALNPTNGVAFSWVDGEKIKMANVELPNTGVKDFTASFNGSISGDLPINLEKVDGNESLIKVYGYTGTGISPQSDNNSLTITYPATHKFELNPSDISGDYEKYGTVLPFVSVPISEDVMWSGDPENGNVTFTGSGTPTLNFRPIFSTIRIRLYLPEVLKTAIACNALSSNASITLSGAQFDGGLELNMDNSVSSGSTANMVSSLRGASAGTPLSNMKTEFSYIGDYSLKNIVGSEGFFVMPIFASRADGITGFTVKFTAEAMVWANEYVPGSYTITAKKTFNISSTTWDYGEEIQIDIPADCWTVTPNPTPNE